MDQFSLRLGLGPRPGLGLRLGLGPELGPTVKARARARVIMARLRLGLN